MIAKIGNSKNTKYLIVQIKIPMKNFLQYKLIELKLLYVINIDCIWNFVCSWWVNYILPISIQSKLN